MFVILGVVILEAFGLSGGVWTEIGKVFFDGEIGCLFFFENLIVFVVV